jgi:hypothetical protein
MSRWAAEAVQIGAARFGLSTIRVEFMTAGVNGTSVLPELNAKAFSFNEIAPYLDEAVEDSDGR